ncbi:MAG: ATP-dependent phosphofructokinase / diphosphate-dependent phosphofructokinase [Candidatus Sumerlaeota bacterium]|nr:ATP-dependent phosphofructokinase / diphosphate-dependent phosphofructokinase [Candidatus Sumerlaeota bacterium]
MSPDSAAIPRRIAILTGGGDCPGLNAVIRAVAKTAMFDYGMDVYGIEDGFRGLIHRNAHQLTSADVSGILTLGGTILGSSNKDNPFDHSMNVNGQKQRLDVSGDCVEYINSMGWDALICIGGDGTQHMANKFHQLGVRVVGIPKTIDNDLEATDLTFGFQTAVDTATEAIDKLHTTAMAHHRVQIVEMMGRYAGWLTLYSGVSGGADVILIPEIEYDLEVVARYCKDRSRHGKRFTIMAVSEGAKPKGGEMTVAKVVSDSPDPVRLGGVGSVLAEQIAELTGLEARATVLGHLQRGGSPCAFDRLLATRFGFAAVEYLAQGQSGVMPALKGADIVPVKLEDAVSHLKLVPPDHHVIRAARALGTCFGDEPEA